MITRQLLRYFPPYIFAEKANNFSSDPYIVYALPVESLDVGQTIGVVFRKPNDGVVGLSLATEEGDFVLRVAFRANYNGLQNTFILNTRKNRVWGRQIAVENPLGMATRIALFVTIGEDGFDISTNNIHLGFFYYKRSLTYDQVKYILWDARDESATTKSALRQISINFPRQE